MTELVIATLLVFFGALSAFIWGGRRQRRRDADARDRAADQTDRRIDDAKPPGGLDGPSVTERLRAMVRRNRR